MQGTIHTYISEKNYGFIKGDDGRDYFFNRDFFSNAQHRASILDDARVEFEPAASPKGYRAKKCVLLNFPDDATSIATYVTPDDFPTTKMKEIKGWEIIDRGQWIVHGSSRDSPDDAHKNLCFNARRVGANALIDVSYYKTTGAEAGSGRGTHHFTIHNFRGRIVTVAKKNSKGTLRLMDLLGLNQRAEAEKQRLMDIFDKSTRKAVKVWAFALPLLGIEWLLLPSGTTYWVVTVITVLIALVIGQIDKDDEWLERG